MELLDLIFWLFKRWRIEELIWLLVNVFLLLVERLHLLGFVSSSESLKHVPLLLSIKRFRSLCHLMLVSHLYRSLSHVVHKCSVLIL